MVGCATEVLALSLGAKVLGERRQKSEEEPSREEKIFNAASPSSPLPVEVREYLVPAEAEGERLDHFLAGKVSNLSRSQIQRFIEKKFVTVNGKVTKPSHKVRKGEYIRLEVPPTGPPELVPEPIPLDILYEDEQLIVVNKPAGMVVHPAPGAYTSTLVHAVLAHSEGRLSHLGGEERPGIVHRLDKDTSGLLLIAKTDFAHRNLQEQIQKRTAERRYLALLWGQPRFTQAEIDLPIGRDPLHRQKMAVILPSQRRGLSQAKHAQTKLIVKERFPFCFLAEAHLKTGRTHQIRVHCSYIGHPVIGDPLYGGRREPPRDFFRSAENYRRLEQLLENLPGQALHAYYLAFEHPISGERLTFEAPPPIPFKELLEFLRSKVKGSEL